MGNTGLEETQAGIKIVGRNINKLRYADDITLMAESEEELKSFLMRVKKESEKAGLKLSIQKMKIMASTPVTSWQTVGGGKWEQWQILFSWAPKITVDSDCSHKIKRHLLLGKIAMTNLDSILKRTDITLPTKVHILKAVVFSSSHVWMWELDIKKAECWRIDAFELWSWKIVLAVPWTARRVNQSIWKEINPEYSLEGLMLKLQYFAHLMRWADSLEKTLMLGKIEGRRRRGWQGMIQLNGIINSIDMKLNKLCKIVKDREAWYATVHGVAKSRTQLSDWRTTRLLVYKCC